MGILDQIHSDYTLDPTTGQVISDKHRRVAELIQEFNPSLRLVYIPYRDRTAEDTHPYAVVHAPPGGKEYVVLSCREDEVDARLLAKLWTADQTNVDVEDYLRKVNAAADLLEKKRIIELKEEARDKAATILRSRLHTYRLGGGRKVSL